jgi:glutamate dehydrogenase
MESYQRYLQDAWHYFSAQRVHDESVKTCLAHYQAQGLESDLALRMAFIAGLNDFLWIVDLAEASRQDFAVVSQRYQEIRAILGLDAVFARLSVLPGLDVWQDRVNDALREKLMQLTGRLLIDIMAASAPSCAAFFTAFKAHDEMHRYVDLIEKINLSTPASLYPYLVLCSQMEKLVSSLAVDANGERAG